MVTLMKQGDSVVVMSVPGGREQPVKIAMKNDEFENLCAQYECLKGRDKMWGRKPKKH